MQLGSYRHNARYTYSFQQSKWHYVEEHNNPECRLRWWRNAWYNRQDAFDDVWTSTATSTYNLSEKHITTQQPNTVFGFSPKSINVPNAQTWHLLICRVIYRAFKHFANSTQKKINSVTCSIWVYLGTTHLLQRAVLCQFCAFTHPQHVAVVPNEGNRLHKYDPQKVSCQYFFLQMAKQKPLALQLRRPLDDGTCDVPKHVGGMMACEEYIYCMSSCFYKLN